MLHSATIVTPRDWDTCGPEVTVFTRHSNDRPARLSLHPFRDGVVGPELACGMQPTGEVANGLRRHRAGAPLARGSYVLQLREGADEAVAHMAGIHVADDGVACRATAAEFASAWQALAHRPFVANGVGKSGTTWLWRLLGRLPGLSCLDMDALGYTGIHWQELAGVEPGTVFHGHLRPANETCALLRDRGIALIGIFRDPRDVLVSEYFHRTHLGTGKDGTRHALGAPREALTPEQIPRWSSTFYAWFDELNWLRHDLGNTCRYEDLLAAPVATLDAALRRLGIELAPAVIEYAVACNDFARLTHGRARGTEDPTSVYRKGIVGDWRTHMPAATDEWLRRYFAEVFAEFGYPP